MEVRELGDATYRGTTTPAVLSMTQYRLHRGLHGKKFSDGTTLTETVDGFVSGSSTDYPYLAGRTREQRLLRVYPDSEWGGTVTTYTRARTELAGTSTDLSKDSALVVPSTVTTRVTEDPRDGTAFTTQYARQVYEYDEHGRQTSLSRQSDAPDMCTRTVYAGDAGDEQVNLLTFPARVQQFTKACTATDGVQVAATRYYYDDNDPAGVLIGQPLGDGNLTLTRTFFKLGQYADELTSYDSNGRIVTATDGNGNTTTVSYPNPITDAVQIVSTTDAKGHTSTTTSDARRMLPVRLVDANGSTTTGYDGLGRLSWVQRPGDTTTSRSATFSYTLDPERTTPAKVSTTTKQPGGGTQTSWIFLDSQGRQRQVQAPAADGTARTTITSTRYDERGLLEATSYPYPAAVAPGTALQQLALTSSALQETRNTYNRRQTLTRQAHYSAGTQQWATTITDTGLRTITNAPGSGVDSTVTVDVLGRVTTRTEGTGATTATTSYSYDVLGALTRSVDPTGHASTQTYDWAGRRTASTDPDAGTTTYTHDDNGNITTTTTATGQVTTTGYDTLDRPTQVKAAATAVATPQVLAEYTYDTAPKGIGRPATSTYRTPDGLTFTSTVTGYTTRGLPTGTSTALPAIAGQPATTYTTGLTYGPADEPATTTLPAVGPLPAETLTHGYDTTSGLPTTLTGATGYVTATGYTYDGTTSTRTTGSTTRGLKTTYTLDPATRRLSTVATDQLTNNAATPVLDDDYTFDDAGNLTRVVDTLPATDVATCHTYDPLGRLTHSWTTTATACTDTDTATAGTAGYNTRWAYNPAGDITAITRGTTTTNHTHTTTGHPHALTTAGTTSYDYDATGRLVSATTGGTTATYQWALNGTLDTVTTAEGTTRTIHAPDGTRLARTTPDGTTTLYLGATELDLHNGTVLTARRYYTHNGHTIAIRTPDGLTFQTTDRQGSAQLQLTPGQATPHRIRTDPYGAPRTGSPTPLTDRSWLGKTTDPTTGLTHLGHRYYDPTTARFITPDPLVNHTTTQALNPYTYANNNPNTYTDPNGLAPTVRMIDGMYGTPKAKRPVIRRMPSPREFYPVLGPIMFDPGVVWTVQRWPSAAGREAARAVYRDIDRARERRETAQIRSIVRQATAAVAKVGLIGTATLATAAVCAYTGGLGCAAAGAVSAATVEAGLRGLNGEPVTLEGLAVAGAVGALPGPPVGRPAGKSAIGPGWFPYGSDKIPPSWSGPGMTKKFRQNPSKEGFVWRGPNQSSVRIDRGNPNSSHTSQQVDHVVVNDRGRIVSRNGDLLPPGTRISDVPAQAHIPLSEWSTCGSWNGP